MSTLHVDTMPLMEWLRKAAVSVYIALKPEEGADDISTGLRRAADRIAALEAERDALREATKRTSEAIYGAFDVPPEHETEPLLWHDGWEQCARWIAARTALQPSKTEERGG